MTTATTTTTRPSASKKFPMVAKLISERTGFHPLESNEDIVKLTKAMHLLEEVIPVSAKETHAIMKSVTDRMMAECASGTNPGKIANAISSAVVTYSIVRDIYAGTAAAITKAKSGNLAGAVGQKAVMYESIVDSVRVPVSLNESSDMKTVFGTIFKEIGEIQLEDFERVAKTLPDFDIFLPRKIFDQIAQKKLEQSARRVSF